MGHLLLTTRILVAGLLLGAIVSPAAAQRVRLKNGAVLTGRIYPTSSVAEHPNADEVHAGEVATRPILLVDDELRRTYVAKSRVAELLDQAPERPVKITPWQNAANGAAKLISVGPALNITPFDEHGRRIYEMQTADGPLAVVQGITELTPRYAKVEALLGPQRTITWDMRLATSSIPRETLNKIIARSIPQDDPQQRLQAVLFYVQAARFHEARDELQRIIEEFPDLEDLDAELAQIKQRASRMLMDELELRRGAGQHRLVKALLDGFPTEDAPGETLVEVRQLSASYRNDDARIKRIGQSLRETVSSIADPDHRGLAAPIADEIVRELTHNNIGRLSPFVQLLDDDSLSPEEKASLALSGWIVGADGADRSLALAVSLVKLRDAIVRYLREPLPSERKFIFESTQSLEGATADRMAKIIAQMKPAWHDPDLVKTPNGFLELAAPGQTEDGDFRYLVQLPPEYDPYRRYPTLLVLNGAYNTPLAELDFWAGAPPADADGQPPQSRRGQAMRHGWITVAVEWQKPHQYHYEFSAREHIAVLTCLRDATRRFSVDSDRVFLTGHDIGGEAAWDLAQAHPDLWAGAMPFVARADKYLAHYWKNSRHVPLCFVAGELDGRNVAENSPVWSRQLRSPGFDVTVVEYRGRGHEPFHDEILHLFDWMKLRSRGAPPAEFTCDTLRPWDNFFWWIECQDFPEQLMMHPTEWSDRGARPAQVQGKVQSENRLLVKTPSRQTTIWLSPDVVKFDAPIHISLNGHKIGPAERTIAPDPQVLLEDVRTRADRQRPFWARLDHPN